MTYKIGDKVRLTEEAIKLYAFQCRDWLRGTLEVVEIVDFEGLWCEELGGLRILFYEDDLRMDKKEVRG